MSLLFSKCRRGTQSWAPRRHFEPFLLLGHPPLGAPAAERLKGGSLNCSGEEDEVLDAEALGAEVQERGGLGLEIPGLGRE